ncbi:MAG TPA: GNAT family N-acetyltransferase [Ktedonobacteraceae bacterium]|nr:GNAT family N-acetyltransferase [Ktedonobacteraceae bacterium]
MEEKQVRYATLDDAHWIVDLSARVQAALTASGSLQHIGPLPLENVEMAIRGRHAYVLEVAERPVGSVLVDPLEQNFPTVVQWGLHTLPTPLWYLHALMLEPGKQGKKLGITFLEGVKRLVIGDSGTIVLDCWAGNEKLRDFYRRAGFIFQGVFPVKDFEVAVFSFSAYDRISL